MGKGIIKVNADTALTWFSEGKRKEDIKDLLMLPDEYAVEGIRKRGAFTSFDGPDGKSQKHESEIELIVSSSHIPETPRADGIHAEVKLQYIQLKKEDNKSLEQIDIYPYPFVVHYFEFDTESFTYVPVPHDQAEVVLA